jgi:hypothetical protein
VKEKNQASRSGGLIEYWGEDKFNLKAICLPDQHV